MGTSTTDGLEEVKYDVGARANKIGKSLPLSGCEATRIISWSFPPHGKLHGSHHRQLPAAHGCADERGHQAQEAAGVDAAGQEESQGHIAHEMALDGGAQRPARPCRHAALSRRPETQLARGAIAEAEGKPQDA